MHVIRQRGHHPQNVKAIGSPIARGPMRTIGARIIIIIIFFSRNVCGYVSVFIYFFRRRHDIDRRSFSVSHSIFVRKAKKKIQRFYYTYIILFRARLWNDLVRPRYISKSQNAAITIRRGKLYGIRKNP